MLGAAAHEAECQIEGHSGAASYCGIARLTRGYAIKPATTHPLGDEWGSARGTSVDYGVLCGVAPIRGVGSSSRTRNRPSAVSALCPAHQRATKALAIGASAK
jgi:hypothetical protein